IPICALPEHAFKIGDLVRFATTGTRLTVVNNQMVLRKGSDKDLVNALTGFQNDPIVVAEAIRALRKIGPHEDRWLMDVLWRERRLRPLAQQVEHELTGLD